MTRTTFVGAAVLAALATLPTPTRAYEWALPDWRATWSAPRLADDRGFAVKATADAVFVAGVTGSQTVGAGDLFLLRYDLEGTLVWHRTWGGFELDQAQALSVDAGGIWVAGSATDDEGRISALVLHFDHDGTLLAEKTWSAGEVTVIQGIAPSGDGLFVAGLVHPTRPNRDLYAARLDAATLEIEWEVRRGAGEWDEAWDLAVDGETVYVVGYETLPPSVTTDGVLLALDAATGASTAVRHWNDGENDEVRALEVGEDTIVLTGGIQAGRSTDIFVASIDKATLERSWVHTTAGTVSGGGGYGVAVGERGIYVAAGNYDFPAGGDTAILRFSHTGELEWSQILGYPAFWDWGFDVDVRDGRFYVAGVLWKAGAEWYEILTLAYDEQFEMATLEGVAAKTGAGDLAGARADMDHFFVGDFLKWAETNGATWSPGPPTLEPGADPDPGALPGPPALPPADPSEIGAPDPNGRSYVWWEGASGFGKNYGFIWIDTARDPMVGEDQGIAAIEGLQDDVASGNYPLVRDYTGIRASLLGGFLRLRYYISHDRLIPQGGYVYVGDVGIAIPPPPV